LADIIRKHATLFAEVEVTEGQNPTPAAGDAVLASGITLKLQQDFHQRNYQGVYGLRDGVAGAQTGAGISFQSEIKGDGSTNTPEVDALLKACFGSVAAGTGDTEINGGTSTSTSLVVDASANFTVGNMILVETTAVSAVYEAAWISAVPNGTTITIEPALSFTPEDNANVKEMRTYQILLPPSDVNSVTLEVWHNADAGAGQADKLVGCRGNVKYDSPRAGSIPMLSFDFTAWNWSQVVDGTRPTPTYDTATPKAALSSKFKIGGTLTNAFDISWDLGAVVTPKISQNSTLGVYGTPHTDYQPKGSFRVHEVHSSKAHFTAWQAGTTTTLIQQLGSALFGTVAWYVPRAQRREVARGDDSGIGSTDVQFDALPQNDGTPTSASAGPGALYLAVG